MISYPQNFQDVVLRRLFPEDYQGFYIDVGANDPEVGSVTKHFYDRGWHGINVEPGRVYEKLCKARPRDVNLNVGLSNRAGELRFYEHLVYSGWSTFCSVLAEQHVREQGCIQRTVPVKTLAEICNQYVRGHIDFLSIDVEGHERQVLEGGNWRHWRPTVVVIESVRPNSKIPNHEPWEPMLIEADYLFALFDGVNRYYLRAEDRRLRPLLQAPANVLDDFVPYERYLQEREIQRLNARLAVLEQDAPRLDGLSPLALKFAYRLQNWSRRFPRLSAAARRLIRKVA